MSEHQTLSNELDEFVESQRHEQEQSKTRLATRIDDLRWLMRQPQGRRIIATLLFDDCDFGMAPTDARASGRLDVAEVWWRLLGTYCRSDLALMFSEKR